MKLIIEFPTEALYKKFLGWFSDGGGEDTFLQWHDPEHLITTDYGGAFEQWGYDPEEDGDPTVKFVYSEEQGA